MIGYDVADEFFQSDDYNIIAVNDGDIVYTTEKERLQFTEELKQVFHECFLVGKGIRSARTSLKKRKSLLH